MGDESYRMNIMVMNDFDDVCAFLIKLGWKHEYHMAPFMVPVGIPKFVFVIHGKKCNDEFKFL